MNLCKAFLALVFSLVCFNCCFAKSFEEFDSYAKVFLQSNKIIEHKVYVEPETVFITSDQILLKFNGAILPVRNISTDQEGIFAPLDEVLVALVDIDPWICPNCGLNNFSTFRKCYRCQTLRPGLKKN